MMKKTRPDHRPDVTASAPSRRARLEALLFAGAALGTALLAVGGTGDPKLPPFVGE